MVESSNQDELAKTALPESDLEHASSGSKEKTGFLSGIGVILLVVLIAVSGWAGYVWVTGDGEFDFRRFAFLGEEKVKLYEAKGRILFNGEPLSDGHVEALPIKKNGRIPDRIIAPIQKDGTFEFYTDFKGNLQKGLPAGEYKLLLKVYHPTRPLEAPQPVLPSEYYEESQTPITITVTSNPEQNDFLLEREGTLQPKKRRGDATGEEN